MRVGCGGLSSGEKGDLGEGDVDDPDSRGARNQRSQTCWQPGEKPGPIEDALSIWLTDW